ncbi:unnamed protein product [Aspergillus oryzae var. brunneus]|uniref:Protein BIG1 n=1 Tax=Aspergillus oryzae var. brunneus TaxID=332754 RepID=A0ABQ6KZT3_ASPOZ|nr:unnamed protein product [Aspergillus oryzae var. brunneus]
MHLSSFSLLALGAATANAFRDTSPFFLASTSEYVLAAVIPIVAGSSSKNQLTSSFRILSTSSQLKTAPSLLDDLSSKLSSCPSDYYVIASQPGVHSTDFATRKSAPRLGAKMTGKDKTIRSTATVNEVVGVLEAKQIQSIIEKECGAQTTVIDGSCKSCEVESRKYVPNLANRCFLWVRRGLSSFLTMVCEQSHNAMREFANRAADGLLSDIIERIPSSKKYTILYVTSPREFGESDSVIYQFETDPYQDPVHMDLKRDFAAHSRRSEPASNKSLFQEYQYLTPGATLK